jgi:predicted NUDIX family phosphoesterase
MSEFLRVAEALFNKYREPMSARQLLNIAIEEKLFSDKLAGKTPHQTMKSKLSVDIRAKGPHSRFVRTRPGRFFLRSLLEDPSKAYTAKPVRATPASETVLVFPSKWLDVNGRFQGIKRNWKRILTSLLKSPVCTYLARMEAEQNEEYKQILTYVMVTRGSKILAFRRGTFNRVEDFLRGSTCIGFGGHVSELDRTLYNAGTDQGVLDNARRELFEELTLPFKDRGRVVTGEGLQIVGLLNDDSSSTGRKHFAVVLRYDATNDAAWRTPQRGEKSVTQLRWLSLGGIGEELRNFEYWSQLCLSEFFPTAVKAQPSYRIRRRAPLRPPHLLCVLGTLGSGKSVATDVLTKDFGYSEINSGRVVAEILGIPPVPQTSREAFQEKAWEFICNANGPAKLAQGIWDHVKALSNPRVLVDGIRQRSTLEELRKIAGSSTVGMLYVYTPPNVSYQFYKARSGDDLSIQDFLRVSDSPVEMEVRSMIGTCDAVLYNWSGRPLYRKAIHQLMKDVLNSGAGRTR